jgi:hypothetical protein
MVNNDGYDEVLENMKKCLFECKTNNKTYSSTKSIDLANCENLRVYEKSLLRMTGIQINYKINKIDAEKHYQISYDIGSKSLTIKNILG